VPNPQTASPDKPQSADVAAESLFVSAPDGLRLHVRRTGEAGQGTLPVVCLPGLTRCTLDFDPLAASLAGGNPARCVYALDYRGRGRSDFDRDWNNYNLAVELGDVLAVFAALGIRKAVIVGTSRGGLLSMLMAAVRPDLIAGVVLNDIGPEIDITGLMRIKGYVGRLPRALTLNDAAVSLRRVFGAQFPALTDADWRTWAWRTFEETAEGLVPRYDIRIAETMQDVSPDNPLPTLWPQFDALAQAPLMLIRGTLTDLLSEGTVAQMRARRPDMDYLEVPDQGHAPLLVEPDVTARIAAFIARCELRP
jgi:pimeloyl-ACP methyl ester carboxylesterase